LDKETSIHISSRD